MQRQSAKPPTSPPPTEEARWTAGVERDHGQKEARIVKDGSRMLRLSLDGAELAGLRKSDGRMPPPRGPGILPGALCRDLQILSPLPRSAVAENTNHDARQSSNASIAGKFAIDHPGSVSHSASDGRAHKAVSKPIKELGIVLILKRKMVTTDFTD